MRQWGRSIRGKVKRSLAKRGAVKTLLEVPSYTLSILAAWLPRRRRTMAAHERGEREFDERHGVDTAGKVELSTMEVVGQYRDYGHFYHGIDPIRFRRMTTMLPIDYGRFTFVDFGSGKGKALLLAAEWPFKAIVGVEFAPQLHRIAEANILSYRSASQRCHALRAICADATDFVLPDEPCVLYFYNPFGEVVLSQVLANVRRSLEARPRDLWVCYANPYAHGPLDDAPFMMLVYAAAGFRIYHADLVRPHRAGSASSVAGYES